MSTAERSCQQRAIVMASFSLLADSASQPQSLSRGGEDGIKGVKVASVRLIDALGPPTNAPSPVIISHRVTATRRADETGGPDEMGSRHPSRQLPTASGACRLPPAPIPVDASPRSGVGGTYRPQKVPDGRRGDEMRWKIGAKKR